MEKTYIPLNAVLDEDFSSLLNMPDLSYQGVLRNRNTESHTLNIDSLNELLGPLSVN